MLSYSRVARATILFQTPWFLSSGCYIVEFHDANLLHLSWGGWEARGSVCYNNRSCYAENTPVLKHPWGCNFRSSCWIGINVPGTSWSPGYKQDCVTIPSLYHPLQSVQSFVLRIRGWEPSSCRLFSNITENVRDHKKERSDAMTLEVSGPLHHYEYETHVTGSDKTL